jgi:hypothetical protein
MEPFRPMATSSPSLFLTVGRFRNLMTPPFFASVEDSDDT